MSSVGGVVWCGRGDDGGVCWVEQQWWRFEVLLMMMHGSIVVFGMDRYVMQATMASGWNVVHMSHELRIRCC